MLSTSLLKVGGAELEPGPELDTLVTIIYKLAQASRLVVVHGGGPEIARMQKRLGIEPQFVDGLRVTDAASLEAAEMVLSGLVNKRLVARLVSAGVRALGLSGIDGGLLQARRMVKPGADLGLVGEIESVNTTLLRWILDGGYTPVLSPISLGPDGSALNVNADHAGLAVAGALKVDEAVFLTNVPGVLDEDRLIPVLTQRRAAMMIDNGTIHGGMVPKVNSALEALHSGIKRVLITNLAGLAAGSGTWVQAEPTEER